MFNDEKRENSLHFIVIVSYLVMRIITHTQKYTYMTERICMNNTNNLSDVDAYIH